MAQRVGASSYCESSSRTQENIKAIFDEAVTVALLTQRNPNIMKEFMCVHSLCSIWPMINCFFLI